MGEDKWPGAIGTRCIRDTVLRVWPGWPGTQMMAKTCEDGVGHIGEVAARQEGAGCARGARAYWWVMGRVSGDWSAGCRTLAMQHNQHKGVADVMEVSLGGPWALG